VHDQFILQWHLVCDFEWVSDFITTIQMFGLIFGSSVFGQLADWFVTVIKILQLTTSGLFVQLLKLYLALNDW
jgi:hypothetical protein